VINIVVLIVIVIHSLWLNSMALKCYHCTAVITRLQWGLKKLK